MKKSSTLTDPALSCLSDEEFSEISIEEIPDEFIAYAEEIGPSDEVMKNIMGYAKSLDIIDSEMAGNFDVILN
ncbi:MAG: hypothetical protein ACEPOW_05010 [Bacteroidales bacterium]